MFPLWKEYVLHDSKMLFLIWGHFLILDVNKDTETRGEESWSPGQIRKVLSDKRRCGR